MVASAHVAQLVNVGFPSRADAGDSFPCSARSVAFAAVLAVLALTLVDVRERPFGGAWATIGPRLSGGCLNRGRESAHGRAALPEHRPPSNRGGTGKDRLGACSTSPISATSWSTAMIR